MRTVRLEGAARVRAGKILLGLLLGVSLVAIAVGCASDGDQKPVAESGWESVGITWTPDAIAGITPGLIGWRSPNDGTPGRLVTVGTPVETVLWESPAPEDAWVQLMSIRADGRQMIGFLDDSRPGESDTGKTVLFREDGSVVVLPVPEGYEAIQSATFVDDGVLAVAYHAAKEEFDTTIGLVSPEGRWQEVTLAGELPDYQFVDRVAVLPATGTVGIVLKLPGGTGDRDDSALVLASLDDGMLTAFTPALFDDALPGIEPLQDGEGVTYVRTWNIVDDEWKPILVTAEWDGSAWRERVLTEPGDLVVAIEGGRMVAHSPSGDYWVRMSSHAEFEGESTLMRLADGAEELEPMGIDVTGVDWFEWVAPVGK